MAQKLQRTRLESCRWRNFFYLTGVAPNLCVNCTENRFIMLCKHMKLKCSNIYFQIWSIVIFFLLSSTCSFEYLPNAGIFLMKRPALDSCILKISWKFRNIVEFHRFCNTVKECLNRWGTVWNLRLTIAPWRVRKRS